jgi:hypothetical protein
MAIVAYPPPRFYEGAATEATFANRPAMHGMPEEEKESYALAAIHAARPLSKTAALAGSGRCGRRADHCGAIVQAELAAPSRFKPRPK